MKALELQKIANKISSRDDLVEFLSMLGNSIGKEDLKILNSVEVVDGCESFAAGLDGWCLHQKIPFDETPTWSLVARIILAGVLND